MTPVIESVANITWIGGTSGSGIMKADAVGRIAAARLQGIEYAVLADGVKFLVSKLSLRNREVEKEEFIIRILAQLLTVKSQGFYVLLYRRQVPLPAISCS